MATFNRPSALPLWCEDNQTNVVQPPVSLAASGYTEGEIPVAQHFNSIFNSLGHWVAYLDQAAGSTLMATTLDMNTRLVEGGHWSFNATTRQLTWDADAMLAIPGAAAADNNIPAGSAVVGPGRALYVSANVPYTTQVNVTQGSAILTNVLQPSQLSVGQLATGMGIPNGATITAINDSNVTLSSAATTSAQQVPVTFVGTGALSPSVADMATFTPSPAVVIIALGGNNSCAVGANANQMLVRNLESKRLLGSGYIGTVEAPAGQALTQGQAVYISTGTADGARALGAVYPCDVSSANGANRNQFLGFSSSAYAQGATAHIVTNGTVGGFSGLKVGAAYYLDPATPGGVTSARPNSAGQYAVVVGQALTTTSVNVFAAGGRANAPIPTGDQEVTGNLQVDGNTTLLGTLSTTSGIKSSADMGYYFHSAYPGGIQQCGVERYSQGNGVRTFGARSYFPVYAGSVVGVAGSAYYNGNADFTIYLYRVTPDGAQALVFSKKLGSLNGYFTVPIPKSQVPFPANSVLYAAVGWSAAGASASAADVTVTLEYGA